MTVESTDPQVERTDRGERTSPRSILDALDEVGTNLGPDPALLDPSTSLETSGRERTRPELVRPTPGHAGALLTRLMAPTSAPDPRRYAAVEGSPASWVIDRLAEEPLDPVTLPEPPIEARPPSPPPEPEPGEVTAPWPAPPRPVNLMPSPTTSAEPTPHRAEPRPPASQDGWDGRWLVVAALVIVVLSALFMAKF